MNLPTWSAYLIAPALVLAFSWQTLVKTQRPLQFAVYAIGMGFVCAAVIHGYTYLRSKKDK